MPLDRRRQGRHFARIAVLVIAFHPCTSMSSPAQQPAPVTAIVGATVIDGTGAPPQSDATVLLQDRRIQAVGPRGTVQVPANAEVIDGRGLFVLPGFVDANVHVTSTEQAASALQYGVTTILDSWGEEWPPKLAVRDSLRSGDILGPRMLVAGRIIGWVSGGSAFWTGAAAQDYRDSLQEGDEGVGQDLIGLDVDSLRVRIRQYLAKGVDFLKYGATAHTSGLILFSSRAQRAIIEEAHKRGVTVQTHATGVDGLRMAVLAGVDLVQHPEGSWDLHGGYAERPWPDDLVQLMVERKVVCALDPISHYAFYDPETPWERTRLLNRQKLIQAGCTIAVTSDWSPGRSTVRAIEAMVSLGMTPMEALVAATRNGALACKRLDEFGTVTAGKLADLVVLRADPLQDITNIEQIATVFAEGKRVAISPDDAP